MTNTRWNEVNLDEAGATGPAGAAVIEALASGESFLAWRRLVVIIEMLAAGMAALGADAGDCARRMIDLEANIAGEVAVGMRVARSTAERHVALAVEARDRLPQSARLLRDGVISLPCFREIVLQTTGVTDGDAIAAVDAAIAQELREIGGVSYGDASNVARRMVAEFDADALRERRRAHSKGVTVSNDVDDATLTIAASVEEIALASKAIDARAARVCKNDSRSCGARRADAALAALTGNKFGCDCGSDNCAVRATDSEIAEEFAKIVVHVIAHESTLNGDSSKAAWFDGFGVIDAHHAREIASRPGTLIRPLDLDAVADCPFQLGNHYRPTAGTDVAMRGVHGTCVFPGCKRPAWGCDLDHVCEYNHEDPAAGGATCQCNLNPKCRFHHLLKTYGEGWIDDQVVDANGVIWTELTTPSGHTVRSRARNQWLLPQLGLIPCKHGRPVAPGVIDAATEPERKRTRTQAKHAQRMQIRSQRRYAMACAKAAATAQYDSAEPPPF
ncbi:DUF222 domain-containing protein [Gordonia sp. (in: high G+C Gram-positive bacteria)]|uniref:HNH endonuclease signature motif containing protein n=1 Tax=Gordonia sp. (in: high G+C Gram-positive bacteria) TaxID=84139 RepID=UPI003C75BD0F